MSKEKNRSNNLVVKSNQLIEARYRLTLQEQRLLAIMISDIKPEDKEFKKYRYKISDILEWLQIEDKGYYKKLRNITRKLLSRTVSIYNTQENSLFQTHWLAGSKYYFKQGIIELSFHPDLKPYLLQLKRCFTKYALKNILELKSKYAFRLYELLKQYQEVGTREFSIDELREKLGLKEGELKQWIHFKTRVLEISKREINSKTDLKIDYKTKKVKRKIEYIIFSIKGIKKEKIDDNQNDKYEDLIKLIPEQYRKLKTITKAIDKYLNKEGFEYCKRNIEYANHHANENYRVFLLKSLKEDWGFAWWEEKKQEQEQKQEQEKQKQQEYQKFLERIRPYVGKNVRIATISALCGILQKDGSLKIETPKGDRIISAEEIQSFLKKKDVIEEWEGSNVKIPPRRR